MKLELDGLTKEFGDFTAVNHINLTMTNGVYGLLGVNGAGKTTLMRMLCTLLKPTSGMICCNGKDIFNMDSEYKANAARCAALREKGVVPTLAVIRVGDKSGMIVPRYANIGEDCGSA